MDVRPFSWIPTEAGIVREIDRSAADFAEYAQEIAVGYRLDLGP